MPPVPQSSEVSEPRFKPRQSCSQVVPQLRNKEVLDTYKPPPVKHTAGGTLLLPQVTELSARADLEEQDGGEGGLRRKAMCVHLE